MYLDLMAFLEIVIQKIKKIIEQDVLLLLRTKNENILIDTSPDLRQQLLRHKIKKINKVLYSHMHGDQTHGINDLRAFFINNKKQIDVFADNATSKYLKNSFSYCFDKFSREYPATLKLKKLNKDFLFLIKKKIKIKSIKVKHGNVNSNCFIIEKKVAYISDVSKIYDKDLKFFKNLKYLILDCLWYRFHPSHFNLEKSLEFIKLSKPKKSILTNLHTDLDYSTLKKDYQKCNSSS